MKLHPVVAITVLAGAVAGAAHGDARRYELDGHQLKVPLPLGFEPGKATLTPDSAAALTYVADYLAAKPYVSSLRVEVHADAAGSPAAAQTLTERRALAVARALVGKGVECKRLVPVGFGATRPIADNATPDGRAANRRTSFVHAALRGRPIGGMPLDGGGRIAGDPCAGNT